MLNLLAHMTGGRYFAIASPDDMKEACASVAEDLRYQYVLGFETQGTGKNAFRTIQVRGAQQEGEAGTFEEGLSGAPPRVGPEVTPDLGRGDDSDDRSGFINPGWRT